MTPVRFARIGFLVGTVVAGCSSGDGLVRLEFPNSVAQSALRRMTVELFDQLTGRSCAGLLGTAADRMDLVRSPVRQAEFTCASDDTTDCDPSWLAAVELTGVRPGRSVLYVRGYSSVSDDAPVIFEGCTEQFDTDSLGDPLPIQMRFVLPDTARLEPVAGTRQVVLGPGPAQQALQVRVVASDPRLTQGARNQHELPGFPVGFRVVAGEATLSQSVAIADQDGLAQVQLELQAMGTAEVEVSADWENAGQGPSRGDPPDPDPLVYYASAVEPARFGEGEQVMGLPGEVASVTLGDFDGSGSLDAAVLTCLRQEGESCQILRDTRVSERLGRSGLVTVLNPGTSPVLSDVQNLPGRAPVKVVAFEERGRTLLGVLHARQGDCAPVPGTCGPTQAVCICEDAAGIPCACEVSSLQVLEYTGVDWNEWASITTTSSNAVDLEVASKFGRAYLAMPLRGRLDNRQRCDPSRNCGECPSDEFCDQSGRCAMSSQRIEQFQVTPDDPGFRLFDAVRCRCSQFGRVPICPVPPPRLCSPLDPPQNEVDDCGQSVLARIPAGPIRSALVPRGLGYNRHTGDFVVAAQATTSFVESSGINDMDDAADAWTYRPEKQTSMNADMRDLWVVSMDEVVDVEQDSLASGLGGQGPQLGKCDAPGAFECLLDESLPGCELRGPCRPDLVWWSDTPCQSFSCPIVGTEDEQAAAQGCLGIVVTSARRNEGLSAEYTELDDLPLSDPVHCRRYPLSARPTDACIGDFNADGFRDVAMLFESGDLSVFHGDGHGGLAGMPVTETIAASGGGGKLACQDLNRDGATDVIAVGRQSRVLTILRAEP